MNQLLDGYRVYSTVVTPLAPLSHRFKPVMNRVVDSKDIHRSMV